MKILYFTNIPSPYKVLFLNELSKNNDITVLYDGEEGDKRNADWYKNNEYSFKQIYLDKFPLTQLKGIIKERFDIVIIGTYASIAGAILITLLKRNEIPFFINADGGFVDKNDTVFTKKIKTHFISKASFYLSSGKKTNEYLTHYGANENNIYIYPFSSLLKKDILNVPIEYDEKMKLRKEKGYNYKRLLVSVGSFIKRKGYDLFIESIKNSEFEDTGFLIIGGGEEKENLQLSINKYNITNVHLIDFCNKDEIFNYLKMSDIFFFPSREDIWGLVINEAMACGLPVISSNNVIASIELIDEQYLYSPNNLEEQLKKIETMINLSNNELYNIGITNLHTIKNYTIENMAKVHNEIFEKVINE